MMKFSKHYKCYVSFNTRKDGKVEVWAELTNKELGITTTIYVGTHKERVHSSEDVKRWVIIDAFVPKKRKK